MIHLPGRLSYSRSRETLARSQVLRRTWPIMLDLFVAAIGLACFYGVVRIATLWMGHAEPQMVISLAPGSLPKYAFFSIVRMSLAYFLSLAFAITYGYIAAYSQRFESLMIAGLDILQSIPVLSFLPGVMLAMVALFPTRQVGVELGAIILIFTGQAWNIAFSFYSSLKSLPKELQEASTIYGFSRWQRFWQLELPYSAIGLIWNSMVSVAGGWFFLMACEMFVLGTRDFRLPGLGSYLQTAASQGNFPAMLWGIATMIAIVVATDQMIWRPMIAYSDLFKFEQSEGKARVRSPLLHALQHSTASRAFSRKVIRPMNESLYRHFAKKRSSHPDDERPERTPTSRILRTVLFGLAILAIGYSATRAVEMLRTVQAHQFLMILEGAGATFLRVNLALLLASLWTIPVGVAIGFNPRLAKLAQPIAQVAASVPATALFPILIVALVRVGGGMGLAAILLMLLGTQWYILFNVIAGAMAIPTDMLEVARLYRFTTLQKWQTVILPGIFPYLITGLLTASGGAWNASIVAEYYHLKDHTLQTFGLGQQISSATDGGQFQLLLLATIVMAIMVVTVNRLVWRPLFRLSETKYKLGA